MKVIPTKLPDVVIFEPEVFGDDRGFFMESWNRQSFSALGFELDFVQDNHSRSVSGVLRGLHFQRRKPQGKLVRVVSGAVFDVAVDIRPGSDTFGKWIGVELSATNRRMMWVPPGFAHGFLTLQDGTDFLYKCTQFYDPADEGSIRWDDSTIGIEWPLNGSEPTLSTKDSAALSLKATQLP
ncbi:dTDP-4-dehydrorhamnose 3,5-epimerase [Croceicoccus naphthovorans]|uniref:dTDP-4-dehydrorhamnose 3,5-epimerase n=1 Tax=Croceicoccus naphthovorans TaxID=1348774 RepID=A0A0G3XHR2_9SPHN|nr:dTDP-4-dehydrorhamnose 3,5-epimerase [Croceicoccus naphthovorans]AKM10156.1 dTDP-4-dehydrorhamnose 3,5-epimerase [Croceicoccus naphthovorans]MBB3990616.1 dTDP-4-dehydrorhamnose 3,5-epimerase [Croceicoccus naphthovorans]